mmetsp:Transcript_18462/g.30082  ORF Transcript_18462/g.30082 Transcript_18462/m.30082 type:complete len:560 (-) Transcript_18462:6106-7785(-)
MRLVQDRVFGRDIDASLTRSVFHHIFQLRRFRAPLGHGFLQLFRRCLVVATKEFDDLVGLAKEGRIPDRPGKHRPKRQHAQRDQHDHRALMGVFMRMLVAARCAIEGQEHQPPRIEGREQRRDHQRPKGETVAGGKGALDHGILGRKACKPDPSRQRDPHASDGQRADHHGPERIRDLFAQAPVIHHVLFMVHRMDHRPRPQKQHRLEEGVGEQVEHCHRIDAYACGDEHIAQLRTGRISDDALDVGLDQPHSRGKESRGRPQHGNEGRGLRCEFHQRRHAADEEHTGGDHGRGVDQGGHRRRPLHRVRQPGVQDQLRRFAHGPDKEQHGNQVGGIPLAPEEGQLRFGNRGHRGKDVVKADAVGEEKERKDTKRKAKITHPVDHKGLDRGGIGAWLAVIEPDEKVGGHAHPFPAKEHLDQIIGRHQHQHRKGKKAEIGKEAGLVALAFFPLRVLVHVAERIEVDEGRHRGDHDQHGGREAIQADGPIGAQAAALDPAQDLNALRGAVKGQEHDPGQDGRQEQHAGGNPHGRGLAKDAPAKAAEQCANQRGKEDNGFHVP